MSEVESGVLKFGYHTANIIVMHDDPVVFAVTDRVSQVVFVLMAAIAVLAI